MRQVYDLSQLDWTLTGYTPYVWHFEQSYRIGEIKTVDTGPVPARVPGSVQAALRDAGVIPDWEVGMNGRACEWVENRHWVYRTTLPDAWCAGDGNIVLHCQGLDYCGEVYLNGKLVAPFTGSYVPHRFDCTPFIQSDNNILEILFTLPPRWLGQFGYTSQMTEWKVRFNYTWDWVPRLVQLGIWDDMFLEVSDANSLDLRCTADADVPTATGMLQLGGTIAGAAGEQVRLTLVTGDNIIRTAVVSCADFAQGIRWEGLPVESLVEQSGRRASAVYRTG